jgi:hypothetical protein
MVGNYLRGAFVQFMPTLLIPIPNVIIFQYNPETITHTLTPPPGAPSSGTGGSGAPLANPLAVRGDPGESFSFTLAVDASDTIADGSDVTAGIAKLSGVYSRLAALEMLQFPTGSTGGGLLGSVTASLSAGGLSIGGSASAQVNRTIPESQVPTVLWVWGPGRILPVRVTGLTITEKLYDPTLLHPTHAEAQIGIRVLTPEELVFVNGPLKDLAKAAYTYSQTLRQALALANLANAAESIIGLLPV